VLTGRALTAGRLTGRALTAGRLTGRALTGRSLTGRSLTGTARPAGEDRVDGLGRSDVVVRLQRHGNPVTLDAELLKELDARARGRIPTTHMFT
jgi:hypothetical protein